MEVTTNCADRPELKAYRFMAKHSVTDSGDLRKYFSAIPNIVLQLGLSPYELALYVHLKQVAGDDGGVCWKSRATLAKESGMSSGMVTKARQGLEKPRQELRGAPLIRVAEEASKSGGLPTCRITITDIWAVNMTRFATSPHDVDTRATSPHDRATSYSDQPTSPQRLKEKPLKKNPEEEIRGYPFNHFAVVEYSETLNPEPPLAIHQAEVIAEAVADSELSRAVWTKILLLFKGNGYQRRHAGNAVDRYRSEMSLIAQGKRESPIASEVKRTQTIRERMAIQ